MTTRNHDRALHRNPPRSRRPPGRWSDDDTPEELDLLNQIWGVDAGPQTVLTLAADGEVAGCGLNTHDELGTGLTLEILAVPTPVAGFAAGSRTTSISIGYLHGLAAAASPDIENAVQITHEAAIGDVSVREGDSGSRIATLTISLNRPLPVKENE